MTLLKRILACGSAFGGCLALDMGSKWLARTYLATAHVHHTLVPQAVWLRLTYNPHGMYGILGILPPALRITLAVSVLLLLGLELHHSARDSDHARERGVALAVLLAGGAGNAIELFTRKAGVTDFLELGIGQPWPIFGIFNLADVFITLGVAMLLWFEHRHSQRSAFTLRRS
jgi:lipoprotein signal peptidase